MTLEQALLSAWAALVFWGLGQVWFGQIVVYPLFGQVGAREYRAYHCFYSSRIPVVVIAPGFALFLLPVPLALWGPALPVWMHASNIGAGLVGLLITVLLQIPRHGRLERGGRDVRTIRELIAFNWPRTAAITVQALLVALMVRHVLGAG